MKYLDGIKPHRSTCSMCYSVSRWVKTLPTRAHVGKNMVALIVFNERQPCKSYILKEHLQ